LCCAVLILLDLFVSTVGRLFSCVEIFITVVRAALDFTSPVPGFLHFLGRSFTSPRSDFVVLCPDFVSPRASVAASLSTLPFFPLFLCLVPGVLREICCAVFCSSSRFLQVAQARARAPAGPQLRLVLHPAGTKVFLSAAAQSGSVLLLLPPGAVRFGGLGFCCQLQLNLIWLGRGRALVFLWIGAAAFSVSKTKFFDRW
jgi:hypothetical protein